MTHTPAPSAAPIAFIAVGALLLLALLGVTLGALTEPGGGGTAPSSAPSTATPGATPAVLAAGSAWPAQTVTPVPTPTPVPTTPTPTSTPTPTVPPPLEIDASLQVCRDQHDGRCIDRLRQVDDDEPFVVVLGFDASAPGDTFVFRLHGPDGQVVNGGVIEVVGGPGRAWSTFRGGLDEGRWSAVVTRGETQVARTEFRVR